MPSVEAPKRKRGRPPKDPNAVRVPRPKPKKKYGKKKPAPRKPRPKAPPKIRTTDAIIEKETYRIPRVKLENGLSLLMYNKSVGCDDETLHEDLEHCYPNIVSVVECVPKEKEALFSPRRLLLEARLCLLNQDWESYYKIVQLLLRYRNHARFMVLEKLILIGILYGPCAQRNAVLKSYLTYLFKCKNEADIETKIQFIMQIRVINDEDQILEYLNFVKNRKPYKNQKKQEHIDLTTYNFNNAKDVCNEIASQSVRRRTQYLKFTSQ